MYSNQETIINQNVLFIQIKGNGDKKGNSTVGHVFILNEAIHISNVVISKQAFTQPNYARQLGGMSSGVGVWKATTSQCAHKS